jgi:hypothetical protein
MRSRYRDNDRTARRPGVACAVRRWRPRDENDDDWDEADVEREKPSRREEGRVRRRTDRLEDDALDSLPGSDPPWLPPARR